MKLAKLFVLCIILGILAFTSIAFAEIDPDSISGMWLFDEGKGGDAEDSAGKFDGELNGDAQWVNGKFGSGLEFKGADYVLLEDSDKGLPFGGVEPFTITAWVKNQGGGTIIGKFNGGVIGAYILTINSGGVFGFHREVAPWSLAGSKAIQAGEFGHVAATYDGAEMRIYVNGKLDTKQDRAAQNTDLATPVLIGARYTNNNPSEFFRGVLDEVILFNIALTEDQIGEVKQGMSPLKAVSPMDKTASTWGKIKF